jgi:hypothetical protein
MPDTYQAKTVRILITSPSDVAAERKAAVEVIRGRAAPKSDVVLAPSVSPDFRHAITPFSFLPS